MCIIYIKVIASVGCRVNNVIRNGRPACAKSMIPCERDSAIRRSGD